MHWELLAIWAIVIATVMWFVRDEQRRRRDQDLERAARYYALAPQFSRPDATAPVPPPATRVGGLSQAQRQFFQQYQR